MLENVGIRNIKAFFKRLVIRNYIKALLRRKVAPIDNYKDIYTYKI